MFHPSVGDTVTKDQAGLDHFKAEFACTIHAIPCPAVLSKGSKVASKSKNTVKVKDASFDEVCNATQHFPGSNNATG